MTKLCHYLAIQFYKFQFINEEDINALRFAFELIITQFLTYLSLIICGILLDKFVETILYLLLFTILRKNIQGYHADTFGMCYILTMLNYFVVIFLLEINLPYYLINIFIIPTVLFGFQKDERKKVYIMTLLYAIVQFIFYMYHHIYMIQMYSLIYGIVILMKYIGAWKDKQTEGEIS